MPRACCSAHLPAALTPATPPIPWTRPPHMDTWTRECRSCPQDQCQLVSPCLKMPGRQRTSYARKRAHASRRPIFTAVPPSRAAPPSPPRTLRRLDGGGGGPAPGLLSNAGYACGAPRPEGPVEFPPAPSCSTGFWPLALRSPNPGYRGWGCGAADAPAAVVAAPAMAETAKCDPRGVPAQSDSHETVQTCTSC